MTHFLQGIGAWLADWFLDRWLALRAWVVTKWQQIRARNTGDE